MPPLKSARTGHQLLSSRREETTVNCSFSPCTGIAHLRPLSPEISPSIKHAGPQGCTRSVAWLANHYDPGPWTLCARFKAFWGACARFQPKRQLAVQHPSAILRLACADSMRGRPRRSTSHASSPGTSMDGDEHRRAVIPLSSQVSFTVPELSITAGAGANETGAQAVLT